MENEINTNEADSYDHGEIYEVEEELSEYETTMRDARDYYYSQRGC